MTTAIFAVLRSSVLKQPLPYPDANRLISLDSPVPGLGPGAGLVAATVSTRALALLVNGVSTLDLVIFVAVPTLLVAVALVASYLRARRAARVDPVVALRTE